MKTGVIRINKALHSGWRIDPSLHLSEGAKVRSALANIPYELTTVSKCSSSIFLGNIFSRCFVKKPEFGVTYLSASDTVLADIETRRYLSKKQAAKLDYLMLGKDWILVTCSGTLGNVTFTNSAFSGKIATHDLIRIIPSDNKYKRGCLYAFLSSKFGYYQITQSQFGGVVKHINDKQIGAILVPKFPEKFQLEVDNLIQESARLRVEALDELSFADSVLMQKAELRELSDEDYDYYGHRGYQRKVSCFSRTIQDIGTTTINAFNHSERIRKTKSYICCQTKPLRSLLLGNDTFSTGSFPRIEVKTGCGIMLINQSDIFDTIIKGKYISRRGVKADNLVEYGEVLVAGVGTLGENETFCRAIFANEDLTGQLVSGEFIRMKTTNEMPSGYLFTWLNSDYGFRLLRNLQAGTKLCRPIPKLVLEIPVPIIDKESMLEIDRLVREAHTKRHLANQKELKAISMVELEIEKWNN